MEVGIVPSDQRPREGFVRIKMPILLVAVALLATSCFKSETLIRVNEDGSGVIESLIALDIDAALDLANAFGTEDAPTIGVDEACDDFEQQTDVPEGAEVRPYEEDGFCGISFTVAFAADEFQQAVAGADAGGDFELRRDGTGWYFESDFTDQGFGGDDLSNAFFPDELFDDAEVTIGIFLPGRMVEHNATYIDTDGTAIWEIDLTGQAGRIFARTESGETILGPGSPDDGGGSAIVGLLVIVAVLALIGGVVWLVIRRRNERGAASTSTETVIGAPSDPVPEPPGSSLPPPPSA